MSTLFSFLSVSISEVTASLSTLKIAPRRAACRLASRAKMGLRRDIPLAANLITGLGMGVAADSVVSDMERAEFVLTEDDGAKAEEELDSIAPAMM